MLGRAVNLYFITKYKNISTRKPKYCRAAMRIKEFILYGLRKAMRGQKGIQSMRHITEKLTGYTG
jgi:hypothetical protein